MDLIFCSFFQCKKVSFQEVDHVKSIFFQCYKIIENVHSIGSWFYISHQYSGCQLIKDFVKRQKRYCCICQYQDRFNLWELNEIKRKVKKLKNYYMDIMTAVCEIKKVTVCKENIWERDIHYVIKNDGIHTYFNEIKSFLFQLQMLFVNLRNLV